MLPFVELDAEVALDPGERVLLADGQDHVVGRKEHGFEHARFLGIGVPFQALELHAGELAVLDHEALGRVIDDDVDAFFFGVVQFPGRSFEVAARPARHHFDILAAQPARGAAAIHGGVADADDRALFRRWSGCGRRRPTPASRCQCGCGRLSWRPGRSRSLPRGAPVPTKTRRYPSFAAATRMLATGEL